MKYFKKFKMIYYKNKIITLIKMKIKANLR